jgi:L-fuculose-phosphate aldolase
VTPPPVHRSQAARDILLCCRRLWQAGLIAGQDGNVTVRYRPDRLLATPRGLLKPDLVAEDLVEVDLQGRHLAGSRKATTELDLHLRVYGAREDCGAVVHAHPPTATAFAVAGEGIPADVLPEVAVLMGEVPVVPYATTGTPALGDALEPFLEACDAVLLANHGAVAWGATLASARIRMESLEHAARILLAARSLGRVIRLTPDQMHDLEQLRGKLRHGQTDLGI